MADHMIKLKEVPKGQKMRYLWDYYRIPALVTIIVVFVLYSIVKAIFFTPGPDINVLLTTKNTVSSENISNFNKALETVLEDYNNDGKKLHQTMPIVINDEAASEEPQYASAMYNKFVGELSSGLTIIQITDEEFYKYYEEQQCLATYDVFKQFGVEMPEGNMDDVIKIPLSQIKIFSDVKHDEELYLTLRPPMNYHIKNEKDKQFYINNLKFINKLLSE